jgi:hypothetical protein
MVIRIFSAAEDGAAVGTELEQGLHLGQAKLLIGCPSSIVQIQIQISKRGRI